MSYARSPSEGDVYVIGTGKGDLHHWECMGCEILPAVMRPAWDYGGDWSGPEHWDTQTFVALSPAQMKAHLLLHRAFGQTVPDRAIDRLSEEAVEWQAKRDAEFDQMMADARKRGSSGNE